MKKQKIYISFLGLLAFILFLRLFNLATTPLSMHIDEAGLGLNAWSIANFGTDRYGNFLPVCPINFYGEQSAFYTYFCALLVKLFGLNIYTLRLPGVIMGVVAVVFGSLILKEKWGNKGLFTGMILMGIFPYFIMNSRFALDCNAMLGALSVALYCLVRLLKKTEREPERKFYGLFTLTGFLFGVVLYTYIIAAIVVAIFCIFFGFYFLFHKKENRSLRFRQLLFMALPLIVMVVPLGLVICVNHFGLEPVVTPFFSVPRMPVNRTEEVAISLSALPEKLRGLLHTLTTDGKYGSSERYFTMYLWSIPFVGAGGIFSIVNAVKNSKLRKLSIDLCMLFIALAEVVMFLLCGLYNYHINGIFVALAYFCVCGILHAATLIKAHKLRVAFCILLGCLYSLSFAGFCKEYFCEKETAAYQVYGGVAEALSLIPKESQDREIYVLSEVGEIYFLSNPLPPYELSSVCDELGYVRDYGNLHFHDPENYEADHVYICTKTSGHYYALSDKTITGHDYAMLETDYYYVFLMD